jgi:hypothetical protein
MEPNLEDVWEQALAAERRYGDDAIEMITVRMIECLKLRDYIEAGFWSAVANRLGDLHAIKTNICPISFSKDHIAPVGMDSDTPSVSVNKIGV